jgi:hypothetical protein
LKRPDGFEDLPEPVVPSMGCLVQLVPVAGATLMFLSLFVIYAIVEAVATREAFPTAFVFWGSVFVLAGPALIAVYPFLAGVPKHAYWIVMRGLADRMHQGRECFDPMSVPAIRQEVVSATTNQGYLATYALKDEDPEVRLAAVNKLELAAPLDHIALW